jgi:hypothetical protein
VRTLGYEEIPDYPKFRAILKDFNSGLTEFFRDIQYCLANKVFVDWEEEIMVEIKEKAKFRRLQKI